MLGVPQFDPLTDRRYTIRSIVRPKRARRHHDDRSPINSILAGCMYKGPKGVFVSGGVFTGENVWDCEDQVGWLTRYAVRLDGKVSLGGWMEGGWRWRREKMPMYEAFR